MTTATLIKTAFNWGFRGLVHYPRGREQGGTQKTRQLRVPDLRQQEERATGWAWLGLLTTQSSSDTPHLQSMALNQHHSLMATPIQATTNTALQSPEPDVTQQQKTIKRLCAGDSLPSSQQGRLAKLKRQVEGMLTESCAQIVVLQDLQQIGSRTHSV